MCIILFVSSFRSVIKESKAYLYASSMHKYITTISIFIFGFISHLSLSLSPFASLSLSGHKSYSPPVLSHFLSVYLSSVPLSHNLSPFIILPLVMPSTIVLLFPFAHILNKNLINMQNHRQCVRIFCPV